MKNAIVFFLLLGMVSLEAIPSASFNKVEANIGQSVILSIQNDNEKILIEKGTVFAPNDESVPWYEITNVIRKKNQLDLEIIFYQSGKQHITISWMEEGKKEEVTADILIKSAVGENETFSEIEGPLSFSGNYFWRLALLLLLLVVLVGGIGFGLYLWWQKKNQPVDAIVEPYIPVKTKFAEHELNEILKQSVLSRKEFYFILSSFIRECVSEKTGTDVSGMIDQDLAVFVNQKTKIPLDQIIQNGCIPGPLKYGEQDQTIVQTDAMSMASFWRKVCLEI